MLQGSIGSEGELYLSGQVYLPDLHFAEEISFLVDTGADSTCLGYEYLVAAGIDLQSLDGFTPCTLRGVGGSAAGVEVPGLLVFVGGDQEFRYPITVTIALPQPKNAGDDEDIPIGALLGLDILRHWYMTCDWAKGVLTFDAPPQVQRVP
ncbi:MAG: hypothetical protein OXK21_05290 [Chloroflexota bacterium]|nr:hypothetical protein [Chloroflexota bacterium]